MEQAFETTLDTRDRPDRYALLGEHRILVVEDEVIIAMEIQATLEEGGAEIVGPANTLSRALDLAGGDGITAAILDLRLGRSSIGPVARLLARRGIPFLFYTGQAANDPILVEWPGREIVFKPASKRELIGAIGRLLNGKEKQALFGRV